MNKTKKLNLIGQLCLLAAILVWGSSFVILKETLKTVPTFYVLAIRFLVSSIILALIFIKKVIKIKAKTLARGLILGAFLAGAYAFQTVGLLNTTPAKNAFLTSAYCVMCPFLIWMFFKIKPELKNVIAAILAIVGIGFTALSGSSFGELSTLLGDGLTLISAVFFAFQIIFIDKYQKDGEDSIQLLIIELLAVGVIFTIVSLAYELPSGGIAIYALNLDQLLKVGFLTLICTLFAQAMQIIGQRYATPAQASIILSGEAVFGALFSVLVGYEKLTVWLIIGFAIIFIAMLMTELDFKNVFKKNKKEERDYMFDSNE